MVYEKSYLYKNVNIPLFPGTPEMLSPVSMEPPTPPPQPSPGAYSQRPPGAPYINNITGNFNSTQSGPQRFQYHDTQPQSMPHSMPQSMPQKVDRPPQKYELQSQKYNPQPLRNTSEPLNVSIYGNKAGVGSPQSSHKGFGGAADRLKPDPVSAPIPNVNVEMQSKVNPATTVNKPAAAPVSRVNDDDLALTRSVTFMSFMLFRSFMSFSYSFNML